MADIRAGVSLVNSTPGLAVMKLCFCLLLPAVLLLALYAPALTFLYTAIEAMASSEGLVEALVNPEGALSSLMGPALLYCAAFMLCLLIISIACKFSEAAALGAMSRALCGKGAVSADMDGAGIMRMGRGLKRPLALYSLLNALVIMGLLTLFALAAVIVSAATAGLEEGPWGVFASVALWLPVAAAFTASLVYMHAVRIKAVACIALEGCGAPEAFRTAFKELWKDPRSGNLPCMMILAFVFLQPLMALAAWGLSGLPAGSFPLLISWCILWAALDIYIWLCVTASVLVAHERAREMNISAHRPSTDVLVFEAVESGVLMPSEREGLQDVWGAIGDGHERKKGHGDRGEGDPE